MLECNFGLQYIRTSRPLSVRIVGHINFKRGLRSHSVPKHFCPDRDPRGVGFWGIEKIDRHWRVGNYVRCLSQREFEAKVYSLKY